MRRPAMRCGLAAMAMAAAALAASPARGDVITFTDSKSLEVVSGGTYGGSNTLSLSLPSFNGSLGTLTNVDIALTYGGTGSGTITNNNATGIFGVGFVNTSFSYDGVLSDFDLHPSLEGPGMPQSLGPGMTRPFSGSTSGNDSHSFSVPAYDRNGPPPVVLYRGYPVDLFGGFGVVLSGSIGYHPWSGTVVQVDHFTMFGTFAVKYTFEPAAAVPEPSSLALAAVGGIGLAGHARRRRQATARRSGARPEPDLADRVT